MRNLNPLSQNIYFWKLHQELLTEDWQSKVTSQLQYWLLPFWVHYVFSLCYSLTRDSLAVLTKTPWTFVTVYYFDFTNSRSKFGELKFITANLLSVHVCHKTKATFLARNSSNPINFSFHLQNRTVALKIIKCHELDTIFCFESISTGFYCNVWSGEGWWLIFVFLKVCVNLKGGGGMGPMPGLSPESATVHPCLETPCGQNHTHDQRHYLTSDYVRGGNNIEVKYGTEFRYVWTLLNRCIWWCFE